MTIKEINVEKTIIEQVVRDTLSNHHLLSLEITLEEENGLEIIFELNNPSMPLILVRDEYSISNF